MNEDKFHLLEEALSNLESAATHPRYSIDQTHNQFNQRVWQPEELERLESFASRFVRGSVHAELVEAQPFEKLGANGIHERVNRLAKSLTERFDGVVRGLLDGPSNAYVEAMNGLLQQTKTTAKSFRTLENFFDIAYLRMSKLKHLPATPFVPAAPLSIGYIHRCL